MIRFTITAVPASPVRGGYASGRYDDSPDEGRCLPIRSPGGYSGFVPGAAQCGGCQGPYGVGHGAGARGWGRWPRCCGVTEASPEKNGKRRENIPPLPLRLRMTEPEPGTFFRAGAGGHSRQVFLLEGEWFLLMPPYLPGAWLSGIFRRVQGLEEVPMVSGVQQRVQDGDKTNGRKFCHS